MSQDIFTRDNLLRVENPNILVGESPVKYRVEEIYLDGKLKCFFTREKQFKQVKGYKLSPVLISALFRGGGITTYFNNTLVG